MENSDAFRLLHDLYNNNYYYTEGIKLQEFLQRPDVSETLRIAIDAMNRLDDIDRAQWVPMNSGKEWMRHEEQRLVDAFDRGLSINALAAIHQRSEEAIRKRLILLGKRYR